MKLSTVKRFSLALISLLCFLRVVKLTAQEEESTATPLRDALTSDSVVVITGAAGFLGSELALALHQTYQPKQIICIDSMDKGFGTIKAKHGRHKTDPDLALLEFKRQRVFRLLQTLGPAASFYRVDLRTSIPEYHDSGEVSVLAQIFQQNPDITHVVHMADHHHRGYLNEHEQVDQPRLQAVPRIKGQPKAGMMESILEQIRQFTQTNGRQPHFLYASSSDVYNHRVNETLGTNTNNDESTTTTTKEYLKEQQVLHPPFREEYPITTPSTLLGVSKLLDELMAQTYYELEGIYSVGLRLVQIYGPWGLPGSPVFEMAERLVAGDSPLVLENKEEEEDSKYPYPMTQLDDVRDYLYIDDAIDAILSAMQFRPRVSSSSTKDDNNQKKEPHPLVINVGSGQGTTLRAMAQQLVELFPGVTQIDAIPRTPSTVSYTSISRAQALLNFEPRVSLRDGLEQVLAWHYERSFPYGSKPMDNSALATASSYIATKGSTSCGRYDTECLKGTPVFPCASACAHANQCIPSFWDDVIAYTRALTSGCHTVLYTIALDDTLALLPSTVVRVSENSHPFVQDDDDDDNNNNKDNNCNIAFVSESSVLFQRLSYLRGDNHIVQHGFWRLVAVHVSEHSRQFEALVSLPKLSPGLFFGVATRHAIYVDPDIILHSVPKLLRESRMQPYSPEDILGTTAMLIGKRAHSNSPNRIRYNATRWQDQVQSHAYRMVRIALIDEMSGDGFSQNIDSSLIVHSLANDDGRLFRCDVYGEMVQWGASSDHLAFEFISGLHDMWSRVIAKKGGHEPWWIGDDVQTVDENGAIVETTTQKSLRTQQLSPMDLSFAGDVARRRLAETNMEGDDAVAADDAVVVGDAEHDGFGAVPEQGTEMHTPQKPQERHNAPNVDDFSLGDDWVHNIMGDGDPLPPFPKARDPSAIDVWMGILSSTPTRSFTRIVDMEAVGAVRIDNYDQLARGETIS